jgi:hypothetical protein
MFADPDFVRLGLRRMIPPERITASPSGREGTAGDLFGCEKKPWGRSLEFCVHLG